MHNATWKEMYENCYYRKLYSNQDATVIIQARSLLEVQKRNLYSYYLLCSNFMFC